MLEDKELAEEQNSDSEELRDSMEDDSPEQGENLSIAKNEIPEKADSDGPDVRKNADGSINENANEQAGTDRNIQQMNDWKKEHKNTPKEAMVAAIGVGLLNLDKIKNGLQITGAVLDGLDLIPGIDLGFIPPVIDPLVNILDNFTDDNLSSKLQGSPVPQEQIDSHTLVIDNANEPWK